MHPGAVTHVTDTNQRLINLDIISDEAGVIEAAIPQNPALVPPGYYMLFLIDSNGVPSTAAWVQVDVSKDDIEAIKELTTQDVAAPEDTTAQTAHHH